MKTLNPNRLNQTARRELKTLWVAFFGEPTFEVSDYQGFEVVITREPLEKVAKFLIRREVRNRFLLDLLREEDGSLIFRLVHDDQIRAGKDFRIKNLVPFERSAEDVALMAASGFHLFTGAN